MSTRKERGSSDRHHQHEHPDQSTQGTANGHSAVAHEDAAVLAHALWQARGCPNGSPDEDWFNAVDQLHARGVPSAQP